METALFCPPGCFGKAFGQTQNRQKTQTGKNTAPMLHSTRTYDE